MEFIVRLEDGSQQGPLDQETLRKWVDIDKVKAETPVRNALLQNWKKASDFEFLQDALEAQAVRSHAQAKAKKGFLSKLIAPQEDEPPKEVKPKEAGTAFKYEYIPKPASVGLRLGAALFDWLLLGAFALILLAAGFCFSYLEARNATIQAPETATKAVQTADAEVKPVDSATESRQPSSADNASKGFHRGSLWTDSSANVVYACVSPSAEGALWCERDYLNGLALKLFAVFSLVALAYLGFSLGFFSQTLGMWFWGIFVAKSSDAGPAFPLRTYVFALLGLPLGFLMPIVSFIAPDKRALHDRLAGVRLIGIAAKPKS